MPKHNRLLVVQLDLLPICMLVTCYATGIKFGFGVFVNPPHTKRGALDVHALTTRSDLAGKIDWSNRDRSRFAIGNFTGSNRIRNRNSQPFRSESRSEISIDRFFPPSQILLLVLTCPRPPSACGGELTNTPNRNLIPASGGQHPNRQKVWLDDEQTIMFRHRNVPSKH